MSLKAERAVIKENKTLKKQLEQAQLKEAYLRSEMLERDTEALNHTEAVFALMDWMFENDEVRTLGEAKSKWQLFKETLDESDSTQAALDALDIEITINPQRNQNTVMNWWTQDRQQMAAQNKLN